MPNSISATKFRNGLLRPAASSVVKRVSWAFRRERILLGCTGGHLHGRPGFFRKNPSTTDSVPSHFCKTINPYSSNACPHLQRKTQEGPAKALHSRGSHTGRISGLGEFALRVIQYLADYAAQVRGTIGLLQIAHSTVDASRSLRIAAREQDGQLFETFAEFCSRLRASHLWHHHVQNGQRRCLGFAKAHRFFSVCGRKNAVPQADERLPGHFPDGVMVFREKKRLGAAQFDSRGLTHARSLGTASILRTNRQVDPEKRPLSQLAICMDESSMLLDDSI